MPEHSYHVCMVSYKKYTDGVWGGSCNLYNSPYTNVRFLLVSATYKCMYMYVRTYHVRMYVCIMYVCMYVRIM